MLQQMDCEFALAYAVRPTDWCASGGMHFANYLRIAEELEYAYLRSRGITPVQVEPRGTLGFPRLSARLDLLIDGWFGLELRAQLSAVGHDGKRVYYRFEFSADEGVVARLEFIVACCRFPADGNPFAIPLPDAFVSALFPPNGA